MKKPVSSRPPRGSRSELDWRARVLARVRRLVRRAVPRVVEEVKWRKPSNAMAGVPAWSLPGGGLLCTGETYTDKVKVTFARGADLPDPAGLFNASLDGATRRAVDFRREDDVNEAPFVELVRAAAAAATGDRPGKPVRPGKPRLLAGGNPQIAKGDGEAPVRAYLAAVPGWKRGVARRLDKAITDAVPNVRKAVKWNSPFYGIEGRGWFLSFHVFAGYVKVGFFRGASLAPPPPGESKQKNVRYLNIREKDTIDEAQIKRWVRQAAALPGWEP